MDTDKDLLVGAALSERVIGVFFDVYNELGPGFLESVYENAMAFALRQSGLATTQQAPLTVTFRGQIVGEFRVDLLVENRLIIELKAVSQLTVAHEVQLVNYLKATRIPVGLLLNFGASPQFKRRIFSLHAENPLLSASIRVQKNVQ